MAQTGSSALRTVFSLGGGAPGVMAASGGGGPVLRVIAADELGYVRCAQAAGPDTASLAAMQLVARWGDGARARGVERMALTDGDDESLHALLAGAWRSGNGATRAAASHVATRASLARRCAVAF